MGFMPKEYAQAQGEWVDVSGIPCTPFTIPGPSHDDEMMVLVWRMRVQGDLTRAVVCLAVATIMAGSEPWLGWGWLILALVLMAGAYRAARKADDWGVSRDDV